jgi:hypothetical protein
MQSTVMDIMQVDTDSSEDERVVAYGQQNNDRRDLRVSDAWWKGSTPEEQELLKQLRTKVRARIQAKGEHPTGLRNTPTKPPPEEGGNMMML